MNNTIGSKPIKISPTIESLILDEETGSPQITVRRISAGPPLMNSEIRRERKRERRQQRREQLIGAARRTLSFDES